MASIQQHSQGKRPQEVQLNNILNSSKGSDSSDSSYDFAEDLNKKTCLKRTPKEEKELLFRYKGKHGLKYQKISNEQRQKLIKQVTSTGCTIKSAARDLNINFSTAKAIMQIYRKEGRMSKKVKRVQAYEEFKKPDIVVQVGLKQEQQCLQRQNTVQDTIHFEQIKEQNRNQVVLIQQLNTQNIFLQGRVNQLQQEKQQLNQNYSYLMIQYNQLQQRVRQTTPQYYHPFQI